jgi:hypothetical protein
MSQRPTESQIRHFAPALESLPGSLQPTIEARFKTECDDAVPNGTVVGLENHEIVTTASRPGSSVTATVEGTVCYQTTALRRLRDANTGQPILNQWGNDLHEVDEAVSAAVQTTVNATWSRNEQKWHVHHDGV